MPVRVSVHERGGDDERGLVEPRVDGRILELARADPVRPLSTHAGVGHVSRDGRRIRQPAAVADDVLELPSTDNGVGHTAGIRQEPASVAKRQRVAVTGAEQVRDVPRLRFRS